MNKQKPKFNLPAIPKKSDALFSKIDVLSLETSLNFPKIQSQENLCNIESFNVDNFFSKDGEEENVTRPTLVTCSSLDKQQALSSEKDNQIKILNQEILEIKTNLENSEKEKTILSQEIFGQKRKIEQMENEKGTFIQEISTLKRKIEEMDKEKKTLSFEISTLKTNIESINNFHQSVIRDENNFNQLKQTISEKLKNLKIETKEWDIIDAITKIETIESNQKISDYWMMFFSDFIDISPVLIQHLSKNVQRIFENQAMNQIFKTRIEIYKTSQLSLYEQSVFDKDVFIQFLINKK